ncbi:MAG: hypothetical protein HYY04_13000 [Chloroflexi bacterium]|nr:hypothetical protein [Chloroflexota bacterium]
MRRLLICLLSLGLLLASGCAVRPLLSPLQVNTHRITPNGSGLDDELTVDYTIGERAEVSAVIVGSDGKSYTLRPGNLRAPDDYRLTFKGVITDEATGARRVLPDGTYTLVVRARGDTGRAAEERIEVTIADADTTPVEILDFTGDRATISPNGDAIDDEVHFSYRLTKTGTTQVYVTDTEGNRHLIEGPKKKQATLQGHVWDGSSGGKPLRDGDYTLHVEAWDAAGNLSAISAPLRIENGGVPRLEIVEARFSPTALDRGLPLHVRIKVRNTGNAAIRTMGPPPGTKYTTAMNYASFRDPDDPDRARYFERPGVWRVGVMWTNAPQNYPARWALFEDLDRELLPGEEATIEGTIDVLESSNHEIWFWASVVQEGVGFPGGQVGHRRITIGF